MCFQENEAASFPFETGKWGWCERHRGVGRSAVEGPKRGTGNISFGGKVYQKGPTGSWSCGVFSKFTLKILNHSEKLKELCSEHSYTQHLDFAISILLYFLCYLNIHLSTSFTYQTLFFLMHLKLET